MSLAMSVAEREQFLAEPRVAVLAVERPGRAPVAVSVWYGYAPGGEIEIWSFPGVKEKLIRDCGRFTLTAHSDDWPYRYVSVEGPVVEIQLPAPEGVAHAITVRYLGEEEAPQFMKDWYAADQPLIRMRPEKWLTVDYGKLDS
jgi:hypothetical protein